MTARQSETRGGLEGIQSELRSVVGELRGLDERLTSLGDVTFPRDAHLRSQLQGGIEMARRDMGGAIEILDELLKLDRTKARQRHDQAMRLYARLDALEDDFERLLGSRYREAFTRPPDGP